MKRGEIYYIQRRDTFGSEIMKARPAIIVSNDSLNATSDVVEVVYLTTQPKRDMATHVNIEATGCTSTALCEHIDHVSTVLVGDFCGTCTREEMKQIDAALLASLGIDIDERAKRAANMVTTEDRRLMEQLQVVRAERDRYARMLDFMMQDGRDD